VLEPLTAKVVRAVLRGERGVALAEQIKADIKK